MVVLASRAGTDWHIIMSDPIARNSRYAVILTVSAVVVVVVVVVVVNAAVVATVLGDVLFRGGVGIKSMRVSSFHCPTPWTVPGVV